MIRILGYAILSMGWVVPVAANEICKTALLAYNGKETAAQVDTVAKVLEACKGSHGRNDPLLKKLLNRCDGLYAGGGKAEKRVVDGCKVDAYRYIS